MTRFVHDLHCLQIYLFLIFSVERVKDHFLFDKTHTNVFPVYEVDKIIHITGEVQWNLSTTDAQVTHKSDCSRE